MAMVCQTNSQKITLTPGLNRTTSLKTKTTITTVCQTKMKPSLARTHLILTPMAMDSVTATEPAMARVILVLILHRSTQRSQSTQTVTPTLTLTLTAPAA